MPDTKPKHEGLIEAESIDVKSLPAKVKLEISRFTIAKKQDASQRVLDGISENIFVAIRKILDDKAALELRERTARAIEFETKIELNED